MRAGVEDRHVVDRLEQDGDRGEAEHDDGHGQQVEHHELHLRGADPLAEVLGRSPDHQAGDEHREDREDEDPVEARADTAGATSPSIMFTSGTAPPSGVKLSCALLTAPVDVPVVEAAKIPTRGAPKRASLPSMFAPETPSASTRGLPCDSKVPASAAPPDPEDRHRGEARPSPGACPSTSRPYAYASANGISRSAKISSRFVNGVGFEAGAPSWR